MINVSNIPHVQVEFMSDLDYVWDALGEHGKVRVDVLAHGFDREYVAEVLHADAEDEGLCGLKINRDRGSYHRLYVYLVHS